LNVNGPIVSLTFAEVTKVKIGANKQFHEVVEYYDDGFMTSAGGNVCRNPRNGGYQSFRSPAYNTSITYNIITTEEYFTVHFEADLHNDEQHNLTFRDLMNFKTFHLHGSYEEGTAQQELTMEKTQRCELTLRKAEGDQGFLVRHTAKMWIDDGRTTTP
ncbi:hypothetical protein PENTCL1PPCAC_21534, partial [Pristionchus entomophagus]